MNAPQVSGLVCPFCGPRPLEEFLFRKTVPNVGASSATAAGAAADAGTGIANGANAYEQVYLRADSAERSVEEWQHTGGCRAWLLVERNPSTGLVHVVVFVGDAQ